VFKLGAVVRFSSQPLHRPADRALLCLAEQSPSAETRFLSDETELEEVTQQHRKAHQLHAACRPGDLTGVTALQVHS